MAEIIAKLGLNSARFQQGLTDAERGWEAFGQKLRRRPIEVIPSKSARDSAEVFQEIERAHRQHLGVLNRDRLERAMASGAGGIGDRAGKSAAESASAFSALLPPLPVVERRANGILGLLRRKFSATDIFKDAFRSFGVGLGVGGIAAMVAEHFQTAAASAKQLAGHTNEMYQGTLRLIGVAGGPTRELEMQARQFKELNRDIEDQRRLLASFSILDKVRNPGLMLEQEQALQSLIKQQSDLAAAIDITTIQENRRTEALKRQQVFATNLANIELRHGVEAMKFDERRRALVEEYNVLRSQGALPSTLQENANRQAALEKEREIFFRNEREKREDLARTARLDSEMAAAELRNAGDVEKKQLRLNALRREYAVIQQRATVGSAGMANLNEQRRLENEIAIDQRNAGSARRSTLVELGSSLSTGRAIAPRSRGRSEKERIADRGESYRMQADDAVRTGKSPEYVARLTKMATRDFEKAGGRAEKSLKQIDKTDPAVGQLIRIHKALEEINKNLAPTATEK
jgi:hypothetical protein